MSRIRYRRRPGADRPAGSQRCDPGWLGTSIPIDHWHFHRQLLHRYRIVLAPGDFSAIAASIRDGRARLIERQTNGRAVYSVRVPSVGDRVFVVVSGARNVVTVLRLTRGLKGPENSTLTPILQFSGRVFVLMSGARNVVTVLRPTRRADGRQMARLS